jgi:putative ABC transport system substrate-binding protein
MMVAPEGKRLELLHALVPDASRIGVLFNPDSPDAEAHLTDIESAGQSLGLDLVIIKFADEAALENAFASMNEQQIRALLVAADPLTPIDHIIRLANKFKIAALSFVRSHAVLGVLITYGPSLTDAYRQLGVYTGRVLKGEKPSDMPVWQTVRFELVINLKAAKAIGLTVPPTLLARADEVIE